MLLGIIKQGYRCRDCQVRPPPSPLPSLIGFISSLEVAVHKKCSHLLEDNCQLSMNAITPSLERMSVIPMEEGTEIEGDNMIPLSRLPGQAAQCRTRPIIEGWLIHFELNLPERRLRHYWILANDVITLYNEYNGDLTGNYRNTCPLNLICKGSNRNRVYRVIPLAEIIVVTAYTGESVDNTFPPHALEIRTISNVSAEYSPFPGLLYQ